MSMGIRHERPGVYSSYETSGLTAANAGGGKVAVIAEAGEAEPGKVFQWTSYSRAAADVGECALSRLARIALRNGAGTVYGAAAGTDWDEAVGAVGRLEDVDVVVCGSTELAVQQKVKAMVVECSNARKERIAVVGGAAGETVEQLTGRAAGLNCERVVLAVPGAGDGSGGAVCAAAVAGAIAGNSDPALPLGGAERGGTTRTTTGGAADTAWRELTTILVVDEVIPGLRNALRARFSRAKNTPQTRGAIRSQTVMELEKRVSREIIDGYEDVTVTASEDDPTVCLVEFAFTVAHGLNQVWLSAHITV